MKQMGYGKEVYASAKRMMAERRTRAEKEADTHRQELYTAYPRAQEIERALARTAIAAAKTVLSGGNVKQQLENLRHNNLTLQQELAALIKQAGLPADFLEPHYSCTNCQDTGYIDGKMCGCMKKLLREEAYHNLNRLTPLALSTFESFDLNYYSEEKDASGRSPRRIMERVLDVCMTYARNFSQESSNLIMMGGTGLGKTHLSLAIASAAIQKGFGVVYGSSNNIIAKLEREHFNRDEDIGTSQLLLECDLLILDDLGTEFRNAYAVSEIYNMINTRQMSKRPTIISTNLTMAELQNLYSERFASRILGGYVRLSFAGSDVRLEKRIRQNSR